MKTRLLLPALLFASAMFAPTAFSQGALNPSGPPAQSMRTLTQVEPRTPIGSLPFNISSSGSYYLTGALQGGAGQHGIRVTADNVTLDLGGFALIGNGGTTGVVVTATVKNFSLVNGVVRGWSQQGVILSGASNSQVERLRVSDNGSDGIVVGSTTVIRDCVAAGNTGSGIRVVGTNSRVENNHATGNQLNGYRVDAGGNLIVKNSAAGNTAGDYSIVAGSSYGQILNVPGANFTNDVPWANFGTSCPLGQTLCGNACVELASSIANCGSCGAACSTNHISNVFCMGTCGGNCDVGYADCNNNKQTDGCEAALQSDPNNCGSCGNVCPGGPNASAQCIMGSCTLTCNPGYANCNGSPMDGCEISFYTDPNNCGNCNTVCPAGPDSVAGCSMGFCYVSCTNGKLNCNNNSMDGCEVDPTVNLANCGSCGNVCNDGLACTTDVCAGGGCTASINPGFCVIGGTCYANGSPNPMNPCQVCNSALNNSIWSNATAGTVCVAASCSGGVLTLADVCNGAGTCVDSGSINCAPYTCNGGGTACNTSCSSDANCVASAYCNGSVCQAKKTAGQACGGNNQCISGVCTGVCQ